MARHGKVTFDVAWPGMLFMADRMTSVKTLLREETHFLAYAGNGANGWAVYLVDDADRYKKQQVSPLFHKDFGDTRRAMMEACSRAYGVENNPVVNLGGDHPEECFWWPTGFGGL